MLLQANSSCLSFKSHNDALDYADKLVEDSVRWLAVHNFNIAHRYKSGYLELRLYFSSGPDAEKYHLVLQAVPPRAEYLPGSSDHQSFGVHSASCCCEWKNERVFVGVYDL